MKQSKPKPKKSKPNTAALSVPELLTRILRVPPVKQKQLVGKRLERKKRG